MHNNKENQSNFSPGYAVNRYKIQVFPFLAFLEHHDLFTLSPNKKGL